jgi:hypothetical protein
MVAAERFVQRSRRPFSVWPHVQVDLAQVPDTLGTNAIAIRVSTSRPAHAWCNENVAASQWTQHSFMDTARQNERGIPVDVVRFYFASEANAKTFRKQCAGLSLRDRAIADSAVWVYASGDEVIAEKTATEPRRPTRAA